MDEVSVSDRANQNKDRVLHLFTKRFNLSVNIRVVTAGKALVAGYSDYRGAG